jgi:hypothetical protein
VDALHQAVDFVCLQQAGQAPVGLVDADADDADAIVGVEHGDRVVGPDVEPLPQRSAVPSEQRVQDQRREREVIHPVDVSAHVDLAAVVGVQLGQHLDADLPGLLRQLGNERQGVGGHEAARPWGLDGVADGVEPDGRDPVLCEAFQDTEQVITGCWLADVKVDLAAGEGRPHQAPAASLDDHRCERQTWSRPIDA